MRILIDTSFIVALINETDENHAKARKLSKDLDGTPSIITDAVILEISNSLSRKYKANCIQAIEDFFASTEVTVVRLDQTLFDKAFDLYKSHTDKTYGMVDCISFVVMNDHGISDALTNDRHFVQAGFRALMRESVH
jgi:uncharacterized protein